ncbi:MAG: type II toxin-antitoxin system VapC family toxin [Acidobacteria bacterium]|nr:type II toxin-antitoxin system VapC family toxin [Acidobacteriota bacterium]
MIGVDTNVLVRFFIDDDEDQYERVHRLLRKCRNSGDRVFISAIVLCETAWVLKSTYGYSKSDILGAFEWLLQIEQFRLEDEDAVQQALQLSRSPAADFSDHLIGCRNAKMGCATTLSFDRALARTPHFSQV